MFRNWSSLAVISLIAIFTMLGLQLGNLIQPLYVDDLKIVQSEIGILFFLSNLASGVVRIPIGIASNKYGEKIFIAASMICFALSGGLFLIFETFETLIAPFVLWGIASGIYYTTSWTYIASLSASDGRVKAYGTVGLFQTLGTGLGPFVGGFVANVFGIKAAYLLTSSMYAAVAIVSSKLRNLRRQVGQPERFTESLKALEKTQARRLFGAFSVLYLVRGLYTGISIPSIPLFFRKIHELDYSQIGLITAALSVGSAIGYSVCIRLPTNTDLKKVMACSSIASSLVIMCYIATSSPIIFGLTSLLLGFVTSFGMAGPGVGPVCSALFFGGLPPSIRGFASGIVGTTWRAGLSIGSLVMASFWEAFGIESVFYLFAMLFVVEVAIITLGIPSKNKER